MLALLTGARMKSGIWLAVILPGLLAGGWMACDGIRRVVAGDYVRIDGKLGPWQHLFTAIGVDPMGWPVAAFFIICGMARLGGVAAFAAGLSWGWHAAFLTAILGIWYLPIGTAMSLVTIIALFWPQTPPG
jgi:hypothetical protein